MSADPVLDESRRLEYWGHHGARRRVRLLTCVDGESFYLHITALCSGRRGVQLAYGPASITWKLPVIM